MQMNDQQWKTMHINEHEWTSLSINKLNGDQQTLMSIHRHQEHEQTSVTINNVNKHNWTLVSITERQRKPSGIKEIQRMRFNINENWQASIDINEHQGALGN